MNKIDVPLSDSAVREALGDVRILKYSELKNHKTMEANSKKQHQNHLISGICLFLN